MSFVASFAPQPLVPILLATSHAVGCPGDEGDSAVPSTVLRNVSSINPMPTPRSAQVLPNRQAHLSVAKILCCRRTRPLSPQT